MLGRQNLHIYQWGMIDRMFNPVADDTPHSCVWAGMGSGKTVVALTVIEEFLRSKEFKRALVISTKKAAEHTWATEHEEWDHLAHQGAYTTLLFGSPDQREALLGKRGIHIINQENLPWLTKGYASDWPYDLVIIDDCKGFKRASAETFRNLRYNLPRIKQLYFLNGTPMPNGYIQLWPQIFLVDQGTRLGLSFGEYQKTFFEKMEYNEWKWVPKSEQAVQTILGRLQDVAFSVSVEDYIDLPHALNPPPVTAPLPSKLRNQYKELEKEYLLTLHDGAEVVAGSAGVLQNKLAQFCNGAVYTDPLDPSSPYTVVHDLKLNLLGDVIEETNGENLIVAYNFKSDWERIKKKFPEAVHVNDKNAIKRWNAGEISLMCCHPGSAGHGLNLQFGGRTIVWFGSEWSLELNQQMEERLGAVRQAQSGLNKQPVYIRLAVAGSVEQRIAEALIEKVHTQDELKNEVKLHIRRKAA